MDLNVLWEIAKALGYICLSVMLLLFLMCLMIFLYGMGKALVKLIRN